MEGRAQENPVSNKILTFDSAQTLSARRKNPPELECSDCRETLHYCNDWQIAKSQVRECWALFQIRCRPSNKSLNLFLLSARADKPRADRRKVRLSEDRKSFVIVKSYPLPRSLPNSPFRSLVSLLTHSGLPDGKI